MELPPGFLDELRERTSLEAVVGRQVVWDQKKSSRARGDFWAPCPFHHEKTASFHVLERQGFYKCFSCGAKGDAITFLREAEGMGFMEAVRELAKMAGMEVPAPSPRARAQQDRRAVLSGIVDQAVRHWRMSLASGVGRAARDYLTSRGLTAEDLARFEIGYAPKAGLMAAMTERGLTDADVIASGLCARPDDGREAYDFLRDRIVFPIRDGSGRAVSFGGRAMAADAKAKYLNGPQTELFDKGRTLYNLREARAAAAKGAEVILAEGYMDVIALVRAGMEGAVAPLGTAVTETQLQMLWKMADEPVVALDGDAAGLRSAQKLIDLALPHLAPGRSLRFVLLPPGKDPDDLLREGGPEAVARAFGSPLPLIEMLWRRETEGADLGSPERRAALDARLREVLRAIQDKGVRRHYGDAFFERRRALMDALRPARPGRGPSRAVPRRAGPARGSALAGAEGPALEAMRERVILAALLANPGLFETHEDALAEIEFSPANARLADAIRRCAADPEACRAAVGAALLEDLSRDPHVRVTLRDEPELASLFLGQEIAKLSADRAKRAEIAEAAADLADGADEALTYRLGQAAAAADAARAALSEDRAIVERAQNGVLVDRTERAALGALLKELGLDGRD